MKMIIIHYYYYDDDDDYDGDDDDNDDDDDDDDDDDNDDISMIMMMMMMIWWWYHRWWCICILIYYIGLCWFNQRTKCYLKNHYIPSVLRYGKCSTNYPSNYNARFWITVIIAQVKYEFLTLYIKNNS